MTKPLHSLSPQELADQNIPVEVALRARIEDRSFGSSAYEAGQHDAFQDALAIIEAKR